MTDATLIDSGEETDKSVESERPREPVVHEAEARLGGKLGMAIEDTAARWGLGHLTLPNFTRAYFIGTETELKNRGQNAYSAIRTRGVQRQHKIAPQGQ